jgi:hypothetical protein
MFDVLSKLKNLRSEVAAVTVILVADLIFLSVAVANREKFWWFEFYLLLTFVQVVLLWLCGQLLSIYELRQAASDMRESIEVTGQQTSGSQPLAPEPKTVRKPLSAVQTEIDKQQIP